jgi:hypothetical protein
VRRSLLSRLARRPTQRGWRQPRRAGSSPYSHSIINGFCKPLISLALAPHRAGFTVRCTATLSGIPSRSFHHQSTSIEDSRRFHDDQLSTSIDIYRLPRPLPTPLKLVRVGQGNAHEGLASNASSCCPSSLFCPHFYRHDAARAARVGSVRATHVTRRGRL